ncbi:MAG: hypothetical protein U0326_12335 [Polyangiales bacterium]
MVFVGGCTGGRDTLRTLVREGALALKPAKVDPDEIPDDEFAALKPIRRSIEAAPQLRDRGRSRRSHAGPLRRLAEGVGHRRDGRERRADFPWERAYLRARYTKWKTGSHEGLREASRGKTLDRAKLYVPLRAVPTESAYADARGALVVFDAPSRRYPYSEDARPIRGRRAERARPLARSVGHAPVTSNVVVEAAAGAGKTVLLQHIACVLTSMHLGEACVDHMLDVAAPTAGAPILRVPLLVEARRLAASMTEGTLSEPRGARAEPIEHGAQSVDPSAIRDGLTAGRYLVLVDLLDEVPGVDLRAKVHQALDALLAQGWASRVILTTRPTAHTGLAVSERFRLVQIEALNDDRATAIIARWADAMGEDADYRRGTDIAVRELRKHQGGSDGGPVANPLLLTCALIVYDQQRLARLTRRSLRAVGRDPLSRQDHHGLHLRRQTRAGRACLRRHAARRRNCAGGAEAAEVILRASPELGTVDAAIDLLDRLAADTGPTLRVRS